jgi:serine/threonine protein kinase
MHGDLAARNILIGETSDNCLIAKVSDFGLAKTFYDNISYYKRNRKCLPLRWMAYELLKDGVLTITSDVWSYGVLIWEMFSLGELPYPGKCNNEIFEILKNGYKLPCPDAVKKFPSWPFDMFYRHITERCFVQDPLKRGCFSEIIGLIEGCAKKEELLMYRKISSHR